MPDGWSWPIAAAHRLGALLTPHRRSPPRSRRPAARPAHAGVRASSAGRVPGQGDREGSGSGQPGQAKMASAGGSLEADDGQCRNFHRSARAPPAVRGHAGHIMPAAMNSSSQPHFTTLPCPCASGSRRVGQRQYEVRGFWIPDIRMCALGPPEAPLPETPCAIHVHNPPSRGMDHYPVTRRRKLHALDRILWSSGPVCT